MSTIKSLFLHELADRYDSEKQLVDGLPKIIKAATCKSLQSLLQYHFGETEDHVKKLEKVFAAFDKKPEGEKCAATIGLLKEGEEAVSKFKGSTVLNAAINSAALKIEHHEISSYGSLVEWANLIGNKEAAKFLQEILTEEITAKDALIDLAHKCCNEEALGKSKVVESKAAPKVHTH